MAQPTVAVDESSPQNWFSVFFENPWLTIGSLIAAIVIWSYISSKVQEKTLVPATIKLQVPAGYVITDKRDYQGASIDNQIEIPLYGPVSELEQIKRNETLLVQKTIPPPDADENTSTKPLKITEKDLRLRSGGIPIGIHMDPTSITLNITIEKITTESRPVLQSSLQENIDRFTRGRPASNYKISNITSQISSVDVSGPADDLDNIELVPKQPIDVTGKASRETRQVRLNVQPPVPHVSISPEEVTVSIHITSQMTRLKMDVRFEISTGPKLSSYLQQRNWMFNPEDRMLSLTLRLPKSIKNENFGPGKVHPIMILPPEEIEVLEDPTRPHGVLSKKFIHVFFSRSVENRNKIEVIDIKPDTIRFVSSE